MLNPARRPNEIGKPTCCEDRHQPQTGFLASKPRICLQRVYPKASGAKRDFFTE
jgi:hypothetical protein